MLNYILKSIKLHKKLFIFMLLGFFTITAIVPVAISSLYTSRALVKNDITKYSRGEFDILVRNESAISDIEKKCGLVEENYLAGGKGGITLNQYEQIKKISGIDAAVPVSNIGYFTSNDNGIAIDSTYGDSYYLKADIITYDGVKEYNLESSEVYYIPSNIDKRDSYSGKISEKEFPYIFTSQITPITGGGNTNTVSIFFPKVWDLIVAIDPIEEAKLTGIDNKIASGRYFKNDKIEVINEHMSNFQHIPLIINDDEVTPIKIRISYNNLGLSREEGTKIINSLLKENAKDHIYTEEDYQAYSSQLKKIFNEKPKVNTIDVSQYMKPFKETILILEDNGEVLNPRENGGLNHTQGNLYYKASPIEYIEKKQDIEAVPKGEKDGILIFRELEKSGKAIEECNKDDVLITFDEIGHVRLEKKDKEKLVGSPLGIYGDSYAVQVEDENGNLVDNKEVIPTINPGSFVPSAPHGYTTLNAASIFKGESPIDAIRVRVSGISKYDENAKIKIERVAKEINAVTGLHVDIVAGSSTKQILARIPGYKNVSGIGKVLERWTTLGTATEIVSSWNTIGLVLIVLYFICGIIYLINRISCSIYSRKIEIGILKALGWDDKKIAKVICGEITTAAAIALVLSVIFIIILLKFYTLSYIEVILPITLILSLTIVIFISYYYAKLEQRNINMFHLQAGNIVRKNSLQNTSVLKMIMNNIFAYRKKSMLLIIQIALSGGLGIFTWLSIEATNKFISYTALGKHVNLITEGMNGILIAGSMLLVIFTILDRFSTIVIERKKEIGILKTVGWRDIDVVKVISGEAFVLSIIGTALAALFSIRAYKMIYSTLPIRIFVLLLVYASLICISLLSCIYPLYEAISVNPVEVIMERDIKQSIREIFNLKLIAQFAAGCTAIFIIFAASMYFIGVNKDKQAKEAISETIANGIINKISENNMMNDIKKLCSEENRVFENQTKASEFIIKRLKGFGVNPTVDEFTAPPEIGLVEESIKLVIDEKEYNIDKLKINSQYIVEGSNSVMLNTIVFGKYKGDNFDDKIVIVDTDTSDKTIEKNNEFLKKAAAIVYINETVKRDNEFLSNLTSCGVKILREEKLRNIYVDIKGTGKGGKTILLAAHYGALGKGAGDNASGTAALIELVRVLKSNPVKNDVRILFSAGGEYDFERGLNEYLEKEGENIDAAFVIDTLGTAEEMLFGMRNDDAYGEPSLLKNEKYISLALEETENIDKILRNFALLNRSTNYGLNPPMITPDDIMKLGKTLSEKVEITLSPLNVLRDTYATSALTVRKIDNAIISSKDDRAGTKEDTIEIINKKILKKQTVFIYGLLSDY